MLLGLKAAGEAVHLVLQDATKDGGHDGTAATLGQHVGAVVTRGVWCVYSLEDSVLHRCYQTEGH